MRYTTKRLLQAIFTIWFVVSLGFVMIRYMPGGPMEYVYARMVEADMDPERARQYAEIYLSIMPDEPLWKQYYEYMKSILLHGDLGTSVWFQKPVSEIIFNALPWSIFILLMAILTGFIGGIALGGAMAFVEGSRIDIGATSFALFSTSFPSYFVAVVCLVFLAYRFQVFPSGGRYPTGVGVGINTAFIFGAFYHAALPALSMTIPRMAGTAIGTRANSISILGKDFVRVAHLRGLSTSRITTRYVAHNAILPMYTSLLIRIGSAFGGTVIIEQIFSYQGIGWYFFEAIKARDYPLMMGGFLVTTTTVVIAVFIADFTYSLIDPRINTGGDSHGA